jgi:hypothetical protein
MLGEIDVAHPNAAEKTLQRRDDDLGGMIFGADGLRRMLELDHRMLR